MERPPNGLRQAISNHNQNNQPHHDDATAQGQPHPLFVMQVPVGQPVEARPGRGDLQERHQRQDKGQTVKRIMYVPVPSFGSLPVKQYIGEDTPTFYVLFQYPISGRCQ